MHTTPQHNSPALTNLCPLAFTSPHPLSIPYQSASKNTPNTKLRENPCESMSKHLKERTQFQHLAFRHKRRKYKDLRHVYPGAQNKEQTRFPASGNTPVQSSAKAAVCPGNYTGMAIFSLQNAANTPRSQIKVSSNKGVRYFFR